MNAQITPAQIDQTTQQLSRRAEALALDAEAYRCESRTDFVTGAEQVRLLADMEKALEAKRKTATVPLNAALDAINGWFKAPATALRAAKQRYQITMDGFKRAEDERIAKERREAEQRAREEQAELERRAIAASAKGQTEKAEALIERAVAVKPAEIETAPLKAAGMSFGEHWEFEVTDASKIPRDYLQPDTIKIGQLVRALKNKDQAESLLGGVRVWARAKVSSRGSA